MNLTFKKNIFFARASAKKALAKAKSTVRKNAKSTLHEIADDISPEVSNIKKELSKAAKSLKLDLLKKI